MIGLGCKSPGLRAGVHKAFSKPSQLARLSAPLLGGVRWHPRGRVNNAPLRCRSFLLLLSLLASGHGSGVFFLDHLEEF